MLPGKLYTPEDFIEIARRRLWWIVVPFVVLAIASAGIARLLPNKYQSQTLVLVVPQRVPESYVRATVTSRIEDRVRSIREQILSRSRLERIINEFNLYADMRARLPMEDVIETMRLNVTTRVVREDAFSVSFIADRPETAQKVTERLAGMFSEENMRDREVQAESTNQFLQTQLDEARQRLTEHERKVEEYRRRYAGELPEQVESNLQAIQNAELQIQTLMQSLNSDRDRRLLVERQIADLSDTQQPYVPPPAAGPNAAPAAAQQLEAAEANLRTLETRLTPQHPDLVQARLAVTRLREKRAAEQRPSTPAGTGDAAPPGLSAAETARRSRLSDLQSQLDAADRQITQKLQEEQRLRGVIASYRQRVEAAPTRETEMIALTRDYDTLQRQYRSLLEKYEDSKVAANLERRQIGEQFRILDPAQIPGRPFSPNRPLIAAAGAAGGLLLGLLLAAALEFKDRSLRSAADVALCYALPVLATLATVQTAAERRKAKRRRLMKWSLSAAGVLAGGAAVLWRVIS